MAAQVPWRAARNVARPTHLRLRQGSQVAIAGGCPCRRSRRGSLVEIVTIDNARSNAKLGAKAFLERPARPRRICASAILRLSGALARIAAAVAAAQSWRRMAALGLRLRIELRQYILDRVRGKNPIDRAAMRRDRASLASHPPGAGLCKIRNNVHRSTRSRIKRRPMPKGAAKRRDGWRGLSPRRPPLPCVLR